MLFIIKSNAYEKLSIDKINRNVLKLFIEKHVNINIIELKIISIIYNYIYVYICAYAYECEHNPDGQFCSPEWPSLPRFLFLH